MIRSYFSAMYGDNIRIDYPRLPLIQHTVLMPSFASLERSVVQTLVRQLTKNVKRRAKYRPKFRREIYRLANLAIIRRIYG